VASRASRLSGIAIGERLVVAIATIVPVAVSREACPNETL
jgi:hypothetical protein